jgi:FKBP-type peptidyl-prolyl cis-trans isomerase FkpA
VVRQLFKPFEGLYEGYFTKSRKMNFFLISALAILSFLSSCLKSPDTSYMCTYAPCNLVAPASEVQAVQDYITSNSITATKHCSGMFYRIETDGSGKTADVCSGISVRYKGMLTNGSVFDEHNMPVNFNLSELIIGWKNGIPLIKPGGRILLYIPPSLGYGSQVVYDGNGNPVVPGNSILIFEIDLVGVL